MLQGIFNSPAGKNLKLFSLVKGRHLIIDFFATWCIPCIKALPEIQKMQQSYSKRLLILPVTAEQPTILNQFFKAQPQLASTLNYLPDDRILRSYFPHRMVPHEVWVDSNGIIKAITGGQALNSQIIDAFLSDKVVDAPQKVDDLKVNVRQPLFINGNGGSDTTYSYRSVSSKYLPGGLGTSSIKAEGDKIKRFTSINATALNLFTRAFSKYKLLVYNWNWIVADVADSSKLTYRPHPLTQKWKEENMICYELSFKKAIPDSLFFSYMMQDLNRLFDLSCEVKKKMVLCNVITRAQQDNTVLQSKTTKISGAYTGKMRNQPFARLVDLLCNYKNAIPVVDETGINFNVDMDLDFGLDLRYPAEIDKIKDTLRKYGLVMSQQMRLIDVMYIKDKS